MAIGTVVLATWLWTAAHEAALAAAHSPADTCENWAAIAAAERDVPARLLLGIARVESGRNAEGAIRAWPWTVNADGTGHWFATRREAAAFAERRIEQGADQIDLGCFQLNVKWHGRAFDSLAQMLEPARNTRYAARFLAALHDEFGDWTRAAAAFHSRTPELGRAYLARLAPALEAIPHAGPDREPGTDHGRPGPLFTSRAAAPVLRHGDAPAAARLGSLMPLQGRPASRLVELGPERRQ